MATTRFTGAQNDALPSVTDLRGKEFHLAKVTAAGVTLAGLGEKVAGVISEGKNIGLHSSFHTGNQLKAVADVAIAVGDKLASSADGQVKVAAANQFVFGTAKTAADAGEMVEFYMDQEGGLAD
jgi:hypothetical protein